ncbi:23S rRNA pseudouridine(955/2504/2580) synthase RluC [Exilibacterium tricleocarpae]|uniref:Pseudouridine synthase n=1 Tax=Exilibacterium tricleocarpae TaxID=2591008 RepID=A0A545T8F2_9GAMM|nr:23S rRNA pseudouridine(955/2504/2580) synthase RluC [Exilibacterium tricleocarpae]TQV73479.1 23S rRNA pseudouridine(955/2504/2580) synthase RluC [Exilibacterium tricleocarpae]
MIAPASQSPSVQLVKIDPDQAGQRVDNFLLARLKGVPKSRIYRILRKGEVRVNRGRVKPDHKLQAGDLVRIPPVRVAATTSLPKPGAGLRRVLAEAVLFEDGGLLVIDKPSGLAVHGGSGVSLGLIESLRQLRPQARYLELVHRLDRDTSGCIMVAKKRSVLRHLQEQMRAGRVDKVYQALVAGQWPADRAHINAPLRKNELSSGERIVRVTPDGKPSLTQFSVLQRYDRVTLVEAKPITGRTHQIRVHARHAGHPLVGDDKYGDDALNKTLRELGVRRLFLHAARLAFSLPGADQPTVVRAPLAVDLQEALSRLTPAAPVD